jgi:hypothetical protein
MNTRPTSNDAEKPVCTVRLPRAVPFAIDLYATEDQGSDATTALL